MWCPRCGEENPPGARFCGRCGAALPISPPPQKAAGSLGWFVLLAVIALAGGIALGFFLIQGIRPGEQRMEQPALPTPSTPASPQRPVASPPAFTPLPSPTPSPSPIPAPPRIQRVQERTAWIGGERYLYKDIYFQDPNGDAILVIYEVLWTTLATIRVENDPITATPEIQRMGAVVTATWRCRRLAHAVALRARILDRSGLLSDPVDLIFECR